MNYRLRVTPAQPSAGNLDNLREPNMRMPADTLLFYEMALAEGDQYSALLAAILNGVGTDCGGDADVERVVEEPDF